MGIILALTASCHDDSVKRVYERTVTDYDMVIETAGWLKDGKKHGPWVTYKDGELDSMTTWKDGVQHGPEFAWSFDGSFLGDSYYLHGKQHGRMRTFGGDNNRLTWLGWWKRGRQHGYWCEWKDDCTLFRVEQYARGNWLWTEEPPERECPYTWGELGRHHFDPNDRTYLTPYRKSGRQRRRLPLPY